MRERFTEIIGYDDIKRELEIICDMLENTAEYNKFGVQIKEGIILYGPPGTGKTTMAKCLMSDTGRKSFICRKDASDGDFLKKIKEVFEEAKKSVPAIILLDDMDKFSEKDGDKAEEYVTVQSCMDDIRNLDIFVIGTVNSISSLPKSLRRSGRLGIHIEVPYPEPEYTDKIVDYYLKKFNIADDVQPLAISHMLYGCSCATLENVVNKAATAAAFNREPNISMQHLVDACLDNLFDAPKSTKVVDKKLIEATAYHEAGHAVVAELLAPNSVTIASVRLTEGSDYGFVRYNRPENGNAFKSNIDNYVKISLAGRAATEIVYGEVDLGTYSDNRNAFSKVYRLLEKNCVLGFDTWEWDARSNYTKENIDRKAVYMVEEYYLDVKRLIIENREKLDLFANALIAKETLTYIDIQDLKKSW